MTDSLAVNHAITRPSKLQFVFWAVAMVMLISRFLSFYTYSGADDLHYAFLSQHVLNGSYNMFAANDIYAARTIPVLYQALWFRVFGVNDFTVSMPSLSLLIVLAYTVCFKSGLRKNIFNIILGSSLVYFNPVVVRSTLGNLPDVYIALIGLITFLLIKKSFGYQSKGRAILWGLSAGLILSAGLFVKESIVLLVAGTVIILFFCRKKIPLKFVYAIALSFFAACAGYFLIYYANTGDPFFHYQQIKNSNYFNYCSYDCLPVSHLVRRLTSSVPAGMVISGAFPILLLIPVLISYRKFASTKIHFWKTGLAVLAMLAMYFPFSVFPYVPLCHDVRQFFFLFPFAIILYLNLVEEVLQLKQFINRVNIITCMVFVLTTLLVFISTPFNKWGLFCSGLAALLFAILYFIPQCKQRIVLYLGLPVVLWLSTMYSGFVEPHRGYRNLKELNNKLALEPNSGPGIFYFLNNDTKTHIALINKFDTAKRFLNLDTTQQGFRPFISYQSDPGSFKPGWLIVSENYYENIDNRKRTAIQSMLAGIPRKLHLSETTAFFIVDTAILGKLSQVLNQGMDSGDCY